MWQKKHRGCAVSLSWTQHGTWGKWDTLHRLNYWKVFCKSAHFNINLTNIGTIIKLLWRMDFFFIFCNYLSIYRSMDLWIYISMVHLIFLGLCFLLPPYCPSTWSQFFPIKVSLSSLSVGLVPAAQTCTFRMPASIKSKSALCWLEGSCKISSVQEWGISGSNAVFPAYPQCWLFSDSFTLPLLERYVTENGKFFLCMAQQMINKVSFNV